MNIRFLSLVLAGAFFVGCSADNIEQKQPQDKPTPAPETPKTWEDKSLPNATLISNGKVQIGVDLTRGGGICHFSEAGTKRNLLNHYDTGRFVQQSYYGDSDGSDWNGTPWRYNPVQGGDWKKTPGRIISSEITDSKIIVETEPRNWGGCTALPECRMKEEIELVDNYAKITFKFTYTGGKSHAARHQEMPAMFVDWAFNHLVYYAGSKPWTGDAVKNLTVEAQSLSGIKNYYLGTGTPLKEPWYAWTDDSGWGIGIYTPGTTMCTYYRVGAGPGGPGAVSCSYVAPIRALALPTNFTYTVYLTTGTVDQIRATINKIRSK